MGLKEDLLKKGGAGSATKMNEKPNAEKIPVRGANISLYATPNVLDVKTKVYLKYGSRAFSRYVAKAVKEKVERDGGVILDMDEV